MKQMNDLTNGRANGSNPFRIPEGYMDSFEDRLMQRIAAEEAESKQPRQRPVWRILKPALTLAAMFTLIFGMGYGVLSLTHTLGRGTGTTAPDYARTAEERVLRSVNFNFYDLDPDEETEIDEEDIVSYLVSELSFSELAEIYAQNY